VDVSCNILSVCLPPELEQHVIAGSTGEQAFLKAHVIIEVKANPMFIYFFLFFKNQFNITLYISSRCLFLLFSASRSTFTDIIPKI